MRRAFTMIELLVTIAIIVTLGAIAFRVGNGVVNRMNRAKADGEMQIIAQALDRYKMRYGDYPAKISDESLTKALLGLVAPAGAAMTEPRLIGEELNYAVDDNGTPADDTDDKTYLVDPWGNNYVYYYAAAGDITTAPASRIWTSYAFILISAGPDGSINNAGITTTTGAVDADAHFNNNVNKDNLIYGYDYGDR